MKIDEQQIRTYFIGLLNATAVVFVVFAVVTLCVFVVFVAFVTYEFAVFAKRRGLRASQNKKGAAAVPRAMKAGGVDGPGTNWQQVENRREFRDKTNFGRVLKLSTSFGHFAADANKIILRFF